MKLHDILYLVPPLIAGMIILAIIVHRLRNPATRKAACKVLLIGAGSILGIVGINLIGMHFWGGNFVVVLCSML